MSGAVYLITPIEETKRTPLPRYGMARSGYSLTSGAPTSILIRLKGEKRFRRLMIWQTSNIGTNFVNIGGIPHIVRDVPE